MKLYDMIKAPNPRRVRMFLAEKGMTIESIEIDIPGGENLSPAYLSINPRGTVPTLVLEDGTVLDESVAICRYFEEIQPEPNLLGRTPIEKAQIESCQRHMEFDGLFSVGGIFRNSIAPFANRSMPGSAPALPQSADLVTRGVALTTHFFETLNARLARTEFVAGDRFSIADITGFITVEFARWVKLAPQEDHHHLHRWYAAIKSRPSAKA